MTKCVRFAARFAQDRAENMAAAAGRSELTLVDLSMAQPRTIIPNVPLYFENDSFEGTMLMLFRGFGEKKFDKRESPPLFELQVQGRFKHDMDGADSLIRYGTTQYHGIRPASPCCWLPRSLCSPH
jgi:hypothetical protein